MTDQELQKKRLIAAAIDVAIAVAIGFAFAIAGTVVGFAVTRASHAAGPIAASFLNLLGSIVSLGYILARDVLAGGRSFGKQLQGIHVVNAAGQPVTFTESAMRNAIFAIGSTLGVLAAVIGLLPCLGAFVNCLLTPLWLLGGLASLGAGIFELVKITQDPEGIRLGDQWANTRVTR